MKINVIFGKMENALGWYKKMICDLCSKDYGDIFDSVLRIDYIETGRGKIHEYHLCLNCRRNILDWLESTSKNNKNKRLEEDNIA